MPPPIRLKDHEVDARLIRRRLLFGGLAIIVLTMLLMSRMYYLQVVQFEHHSTLAENNRIHVQSLPPTRGTIYDRNGVVIADNRASFSLTLTRERAGDWETALDFNGQSAPYIQYAVVRANSILRRLTEPAPSKADFSHELMPAEVNLIEKISQLPEVVQKAAADSKPSLVATYSFELAQSFNDFYTQCPVLSAEGSSRRSRLVLVQAAKVALENGLSLLGIQSPQVM